MSLIVFVDFHWNRFKFFFFAFKIVEFCSYSEVQIQLQKDQMKICYIVIQSTL